MNNQENIYFAFVEIYNIFVHWNENLDKKSNRFWKAPDPVSN